MIWLNKYIYTFFIYLKKFTIYTNVCTRNSLFERVKLNIHNYMIRITYSGTHQLNIKF